MSRQKGPEKRRVTISVTEDTLERLKQYAWENHIGDGVSGAITDLIWKAKVKSSQLRGQESIFKE